MLDPDEDLTPIPLPDDAPESDDSGDGMRLLPDVWGEGMLFAFSGMEGETSWADDLVASTLGDRAGFLFHGDAPLAIWPAVRAGARWIDGTAPGERLSAGLVGADVADLRLSCDDDSAVVHVRYAWRTGRALCGEIEPIDAAVSEVRFRVAAEGDVDVRSGEDGTAVIAAGARRLWLAADVPLRVADGGIAADPGADGQVRFVIGIDPQSPAEPAEFREMFGRLVAYLLRIPPPPECEPDEERTYYKCASVAKVNSMRAEGGLAHNWTTPDRHPHGHMWNWDSAFHAIGLRHIAPEWAVESLRAVLALQGPSGWIPHSARPDGNVSSIANPALLAWAGWTVYEEHPDRVFLGELLPAAGAYVAHNMTGRRDGRPALGWLSSRNETGMDNSPRFDSDPDGEILCVDMNAYAVNETEFLALMASELDLSSEADRWRALHDEWAGWVRETFWHPGDRFFYDRRADGEWIRVPTVAGFMPLFSGAATAEQAAALAERVGDADEFWRPFPVSTVSARDGRFTADMWRGPTWINTNYLVATGLDRYGYRDLARHIREASLREIVRWYRRTGVIWEYYDSEGTRSPADLHRKGRIGGAWIHSVVRDYHWTAALAIDLIRTRPWWG